MEEKMNNRILSWPEVLALGLSESHMTGRLLGHPQFSGVITEVTEEDRHIVFTLDRDPGIPNIIIDGPRVLIPKSIMPLLREGGKIFLRIGLANGITITPPVKHSGH